LLQNLYIRNNFGLHLFFDEFLFWLHCSFLQKLLIFSFKNYSFFQSMILVRTNDQTLTNVIFNFLETQKLWNCWIKFNIKVHHLIESTFTIYWYTRDVFLKNFFNIQYLNPMHMLLSYNFYIKSPKLVIISVINALLNMLFWV
jgi:hypothetical protein